MGLVLAIALGIVLAPFLAASIFFVIAALIRGWPWLLAAVLLVFLFLFYAGAQS